MITTVAPRATFHDRTPLSPQPPQFENGKAIHPARPFYELRCVNLQSIRFDGDRAGSEAEALKAHGVVKIIAFDGFVSLWLFNARGSTRDLDNYLPGPFKNETYQGTATDMMLKLEDLIHKVARGRIQG
ncbi:hypothetical protein V5O48_005115 [Marasmius crinis-equi]|uniref:Uncharacterized protein n=1 Tax=Marasmius crinis-equi TaxID=585013 RepID=A0ABR3FNG6_9AGAR